MIQRKQSIWLFIAALLSASVLFFDLYRVHTSVLGVDTVTQLGVSDHYPSLIIVMVMSLLPLITIFMYSDRKRQLRMTLMSIVATASFITMILTRVTNLNKLLPNATSSNYWIGAMLPILSIIFLVMAIVNIRKDDKLVKSMDRLR